MTIVPLFPTMIFHWDADSFKENKDELLKYCYAERKKDPQGVVISNSGGWQSGSGHHEESIIYSFLRKQVGDFLTSTRAFRDGVGVEFSNMWININQKRDYNIVHNHPKSTLSGVFWIKTPENSGKLQFMNSNDFIEYSFLKCLQPCVNDKYFTHLRFQMDLVPGRIVLFPSHLLHGVQPNQSREDRISISFNIHLTEPEEDED